MAVEMTLLPAIGAAYYTTMQPTPTELALFAGGYLFSSLLLSPDLDLHKNAARRRWGPLGFLWAPYSHIFKHRGLSHSLVLGPLTRLIYLGLVLAGVIAGLSYLWELTLPEEVVSFWENRRLLLALGVGLYLPNVLHVLLDRGVSALRPRPRPRPRPSRRHAVRQAGARGR